ncbi:MAG TPA: hypothetical protein VGK02_04225 [Candidatus Aquicultor sp.]|jgi:hypothetical protein
MTEEIKRTDNGEIAKQEQSVEHTKTLYKGIEFAHPSEAQCARILDFYDLSWQYEPKTFPIEWDKEGNVTQSFSPDFYLPDLDLYIELTTMSQKLVTKKNRKVRMLKEIYPDVNIKIFYQKDFKNLLVKYGLPR